MARILLAEADHHVRRFVAGILSDCGHAVETCGDADAAASSLATRAIDIVVTDLFVEFGGDTPLAQDCAARGIPTLSLSGNSLISPRTPADRLPGLLEKPFRFGYLQRVIEAVAGQPEPAPRGVPNGAAEPGGTVRASSEPPQRA